MAGHQRIMTAASGIILILISAVLTFANLFVWMGTCGGDGGYPYSARASTAGKVCSATGNGSSLIWISIWLSVLLVIAFVVCLIRARLRPLLIMAVLVMVLQVGSITTAILPGGDCSDDQRSSLPTRECVTYN